MAERFRPEYLAKECERLSRDDVLNHVLDTMRTNAVDALVYRADASKPEGVIYAQCMVRVIDDLRLELKAQANALEVHRGNDE